MRVERTAPLLLDASGELSGCTKCFTISSNAALPGVTWTSHYQRQNTVNGTILRRRTNNPPNRQKAILHLQCCWPLSRLRCKNRYLGRRQPHQNFQLKLSCHNPKLTSSIQPWWWNTGTSNAPISSYSYQRPTDLTLIRTKTEDTRQGRGFLHFWCGVGGKGGQVLSDTIEVILWLPKE